VYIESYYICIKYSSSPNIITISNAANSIM